MKQRILMTAAQEMNERGVKFTIDAVAAHLGISKKTLYHYYESKDDLIAEIVDAALSDFEEQEKAILNSDNDFEDKLALLITITPQMFGRINDWVYDDIKRFRPVEWQKIEQFRHTRLEVCSNILAEGVAGGYIRPLNTRIAARMLRGAITELMNYQVLAENNLTFVDALKAACDIFLHGVLADNRGR